METEQKSVFIPSCVEHEGIYGVWIKLNWTCPVCGEKRGEPFWSRSYDGSRILHCHGWKNPCEHIDKYSDIRKEASIEGLKAVLR